MKFTWGHGIVVALGLFISFILYLIFVFPIGKQNSELVTENYYEDELSYQKVIDAKNNAETLATKPQYAQLPYGIRIAFTKDIKNENVTPIGSPALVKPMNSGIEEQEQNGVTVPRSAPSILAVIPSNLPNIFLVLSGGKKL